MVILGTWDGRPVTLSLKSNCTTLSIDEPAEARVFSFDLEGRMWTAFLDGVSYRRGLDGKVLAKWRLPGDARERRWLFGDEAHRIEEHACAAVAALADALKSGDAVLSAPLPPEACDVLERIVAFDRARSDADVQRYAEVYKPVGILPPDQYMAVALQAAEGCSFNTCTFCDFYRDRPFHIKTPDEFRVHAEQVRDFLGRGLSLRRTIFLADANALVIPMPRLLPLFDIVREVYDVAALGGIYAFLDGFSGEKKSTADYRALGERGLTRVYIGLESGSPDLLRFLRKPGQPSDAVKAVHAMKQARIAVGVIILLGAGGHTYADQHVHDTISALNAMRLDADDILYFSDLVVGDDLQYARDAVQAGLGELTHEERLEQASSIERGLRFSKRAGTPRISRYDIREFVY